MCLENGKAAPHKVYENGKEPGQAYVETNPGRELLKSEKVAAASSYWAGFQEQAGSPGKALGKQR